MRPRPLALLLVASLAGCVEHPTAPARSDWEEHLFAEHVLFSFPGPATLEPYPVVRDYRAEIRSGNIWMTWSYETRNQYFVVSDSWPKRPDLRVDERTYLLYLDGRRGQLKSCQVNFYESRPYELILWMDDADEQGRRLVVDAVCYSDGARDTVMEVLSSIRFVAPRSVAAGMP